MMIDDSFNLSLLDIPLFRYSDYHRSLKISGYYKIKVSSSSFIGFDLFLNNLMECRTMRYMKLSLANFVFVSFTDSSKLDC